MTFWPSPAGLKIGTSDHSNASKFWRWQVDFRQKILIYYWIAGELHQFIHQWLVDIHISENKFWPLLTQLEKNNSCISSDHSCLVVSLYAVLFPTRRIVWSLMLLLGINFPAALCVFLVNLWSWIWPGSDPYICWTTSRPGQIQGRSHHNKPIARTQRG